MWLILSLVFIKMQALNRSFQYKMVPTLVILGTAKT